MNGYHTSLSVHFYICFKDLSEHQVLKLSMGRELIMKKSIFKDVAVLLLIILIIFIIIQFLPERVPIHFDSQLRADNIVNKHFLLLGALIPYWLYWKYLRK